MNTNTRRLEGQIESTEKEAIGRLQIEAFQKTIHGADRRLGTAKCDAEGRFEIDRGPSGDPMEVPARRPEVYFRVWEGDRCVMDTSDEPRTPDEREEVHLELPGKAIETAQEASRDSAAFSVRGRVVHPDGRAASELIIRAFAVEGPEAGDEVHLDEDVTDADGEYCIPYRVTDETTNGFEVPDLVVRAYEPAEKARGDLVASSPIVVTPGRHQVVDLVVGDEPYRGPSEFDRIRVALDPLTGDGDVEPSADRVSYLAGKTGLPQDRVAVYLQSRRLADQSDAPAAAFYAMLKDGMPGDLSALAATDSEAHRRALSRAADANVIPPSLIEQVDGVTETLKDSAIDRLLSAPADTDGPTLEPVLDLADLSGEDQRTLLERFRNHDGSTEEFWSDLRGDDAWGPDRVARVQTALQVGVLTRYDGDAAAALMDEFTDEDEPLRAMARLDADALADLLESRGVSDDGAGTDAETHARRITRALEDAFPGWVLAHRVDEDDFPLAGEVAGFLKDHPEVDLRTTRVDSYLAENGDGISSELRDGLRAVQRVFNVAPRHEKSRTIRTLLADGVDSAYAIQGMGKAAFSRRYEGQLDEGEIEQIYAHATRTAATAMNLYAYNAPQLDDVPVYAIDGDIDANGTGEPAAGGIPDLEELFGSLDLCACEHCRSIYSPAAYLVDLLAWLKERPAIRREPDGTAEYLSDRTMLDVLTDRRPDLVEIELTCENTNTSLPYIDLVNEVLEEQVRATGETHQTEWDAETLRVQPEHLDPDAYDELVDAFYPWDLPFDLWIEEARTYLGHLGVPRAQLIDRLGDPATGSMSPRVASERLGLTEHDWTIFAGEATEEVWEQWGWESDWHWKTQLDTVSTLLDHSGLAYEELEDILRSRHLNPEGDIHVRHDAPDCDLDHSHLVNRPENGFFDRMHRFVRLMRRLDWTPRQLDAALAAIPPHQTTDSFLVSLGEVVAIRERTGADLEEVLSWFGGLDTHDWGEEPSLYARRFQDETVANPTEASFELESDGTELANTTQFVENHVSAIRAALEVTSEEMNLLIATQLPDEPATSDHPLVLANLSRLYRVVSLAKAVDLRVRDLVVLLEFFDQDPFDGDSPHGMTAFLEDVDRVRRSDFDAAELDYIFRHRRRPGAPVAALDDAVSRTLTGLRDGLRALAADHRIVAEEPLGEQTSDALSALLPEEDVTRAMALLDQSSTEDPTDLEAFIASRFGTFLDAEDAKHELLPFADDAVVEERYRYVLEPLLDHLLRTRREDHVVQELSEALDADPGTVSPLLREILSSRSDPAEPALEDYLGPTFLDSTAERLGPDDAPDAFAQFRRLEKILRLVEGFDVPGGDVRWLIEHGPDFGLIDFRALPVAPDGGDATAQFEAWVQTDRLTELRPVFAKSEGGILRMLEAVRTGETESELRSLVHELTGWPTDDVKFLLSPDGFATTFPDASNLEATLPILHRLSRTFDVLDRLGVSAETAVNWVREDPSFEQARAIKQSVRARYDEETWLDVAEPLRDDLRDKQREALVAYLVDDLSDEGVEDPDDLFERYLLDVEMTSCMLTSRIKQAIASVQLFVQRCRMNLEPECVLTEDDAREWEWRKKYRVWEANRKVFLYPENWIRPELRRDKSPFFEDLESELLQAELTDDNVERGYLNYLEKLDDVARLEIVGCYLETDEDGSDTFHVVGRTRDTPHRHFYRRLEGGTRWTPWESVDADIEGDHVMPVVFNRRLRLVWPVFVPKAVEDDIPTEDEGPSEPNRYWEIQLAWSELRNGKWTPKRITDATHVTAAKHDKSEISFDVAIQNGRLVVSAWYNSVWGIGQFVFTGSGDQVVLESYGTGYLGGYMWAKGPQPGTTIWFNGFREEGTSGNDLELYAEPSTTGLWSPYEREPTVVLDETPGRFELVPPHQFSLYRSQAPLFFQDGDRTFFVTPYRTTRWTGPPVVDGFGEWAKPELIIPEIYEPIPEDPFGGSPFPDGPLGGGDVDPAPPWMRGGFEGGEIVVGGDDNPVTPVGFLDDGGPQLTGDGSGRFSADTETRMVALTATDTTSLGSAPAFAVDTGSGWTPAFGVSSGFQTMSYTGWNTGFGGMFPTHEKVTNYRFSMFYHPYVGRFVQQLNRYGVEGFLAPSASQDTYGLARQLKEETYFEETYEPTSRVDEPYPVDDIDFDSRGAYSLYNWELFFHAPVLVANQLSRNRKFQEAQEWFHYVFDPTDASDHPVPERFWNVKPFHEHPGGRSIHELLALLTRDDLDSEEQKAREDLELQIQEWEDRPFEPHVIARLRQSAYQRSVVMQYLDNLIAWGDELFRRGSLEDLNEATQIYVLAREILGDRPERVSRSDDEQEIQIDGESVRTFEDLEDHLDEHIHAIVELETPLGPAPGGTPAGAGDGPELHLGPVFFFCIPRNDKLLEYWDTVEDRLYKIRHCLNIEGTFQLPPLFEPPIDPGVMVEAAAAGVDISSVLSDLNAPLPNYRFRSMISKAQGVVGEVKSLGASLLQTLEKRDAEELALLRSNQETSVLEAAREVRELQVEEAENSVEALERSRELAEERRDYYQSREFMNAWEIAHTASLMTTGYFQLTSQGLEAAAAAAAIIPEFDAGVEGYSSTPTVKAQFGGSNIANALRAASGGFQMLATASRLAGTMAETMGRYHRRMEDWEFQAEQASKQIEELDKQIAAAKIRLEVAENELENHELRIENSEEISEFMEEKFTNQELYNWMVGQISSVYYQSYQLAHDLAKQCERAYQHELADWDASFVEFGHWDSLRKGLLAGERLAKDLHQMDAAYRERNKREYELTKHVSLSMLDPVAVEMLKQTGVCHVRLPEAFFDLDHPGHYMRRIKTVSLSIPCVTGPYTSVPAELTLLESEIRTDPRPEGPNDGNYARDTTGEDDRFRDVVGTAESIVTSSANRDSGLFETNLHDERYLPFEGAGVVSTWRIELPTELQPFDYDTISDVVFHARYTARDGGQQLASAATAELRSSLNATSRPDTGTGLFEAVSLARDAPDAWHQLLTPPGDNATEVDLGRERFPVVFRDEGIEIGEVALLVEPREAVSGGTTATVDATLPDDSTTEIALTPSPTLEGLLEGSATGLAVEPGTWEFEVTDVPASLADDGRLDPEKVEDIVIVLGYHIDE